MTITNKTVLGLDVTEAAQIRAAAAFRGLRPAKDRTIP
jgi:hypothetical protein